MKFAHAFQAALAEEGFPEHWINSAVNYGQLKKVIKKVTNELRTLGLDSATLAQLLPPQSSIADSNGRRGSGVTTFQYDFNGDQTVFEPKLTLYIENGIPVDASLSADTRMHLQNLVLQQRSAPASGQEDVNLSMTNGYGQVDGSVAESEIARKDIKQIEIPLKFDSQFFKTLQHEVSVLEALQAGEQDAIVEQIAELSNELAALSKPSRFSKTDMNRWRELFAIYLEANIFFSTHELDHGRRDGVTADTQLQWFRNEVVRRGVPDHFKLPASHAAFERFVNINKQLLLNIKFQEINQKAVYKILKKFDKRTQLGVTRTLPKAIQPDSLMPETMAKAVCAQMTQDLVMKVPQIDDYLCPICYTINWRPVRLRCQHLMCISCAVTLQLKGRRFCPFCRDKVIMEMDERNIDRKLESFLEKHFPKEVFMKRIQVETERGKDQFGPNYVHPKDPDNPNPERCIVM